MASRDWPLSRGHLGTDATGAPCCSGGTGRERVKRACCRPVLPRGPIRCHPPGSQRRRVAILLAGGTVREEVPSAPSTRPRDGSRAADGLHLGCWPTTLGCAPAPTAGYLLGAATSLGRIDAVTVHSLTLID